MIADFLQQASLRDPSVYDELLIDGIRPRPHWVDVIESLQAIGSEELATRWRRAERRIRDNGVTYNVYDDDLGANRPWSLDLIPLVIPADEWRTIEAGIVQRAQLLDLVLADLYGPQNLIKDGHLPPALVFANPEFLRPVAGLHAPLGSHLHLIAVDLARSPDGQWWVLADRTQAPSGAGYALENRIIVADVLPDLFKRSNVCRLASFFRAQREALTKLSGVDQPRIVLLTPGPYNETYFEHSYLAQYLGFTLVEGGDLTVRDRRVYLKTVEGLRQVDVILRRVDDSFCDPLELRGDSFLGVSGLVDAVIAGNVKVANALGSGLIETAATMPFLPGLARHLLGEQLKLPSVATWWCGQEYALKWVLDHLDGVVVKPAFPSRRMEPVFGVQLAKAEKDRLAEQMRAWPHEYVAQEQVALSTAPVWDNGRLLPRSMVLRTYALNTGTGWMAMPGGLVRVSGAEGPVVSMQRGGHSKDAWIAWDGPVDTFSLLRPRDQPVELRRSPADLPSRVADDLFWLGRYAERAENIARLLRTSLSWVRRAVGVELDCLLRLHGCFETRHSKLPKKGKATATELERELISLLSDKKRPDSLVATLDEVARVSGRVRDRLSSDMMRLIGQLGESARVEEYMLFVEYSAALSGCLELLSAFSGMERENVTRGSGWLFLSLGRRLERAIYSTRQLRELAAPFTEQDQPFLEFVLEAADSSMTYRSRFYATMQPVAVLDVLLCDRTNPRSLDFQIDHVADLYSKLPRHNPEDLQSMRDAGAMLRGIDLRTLDYARLNRSLRALESLLPAWSNNLSSTYFIHAITLPTAVFE
jgi:uncharacterized circularly permuted ATP-grasp superfamily protein/uncharacterized alpha-E superfamily protein